MPRRRAHAAGTEVAGSGMGMVVRKAEAAPSCQTNPGSDKVKVRIEIGSVGSIQFQDPVEFETALK
jgi:hypothetical protein